MKKLLLLLFFLFTYLLSFSQAGNCLDFLRSSNEYVSAGESSSIISTGSSFTLEVWIKTSTQHGPYSTSNEGRVVNLHRQNTAGTGAVIMVGGVISSTGDRDNVTMMLYVGSTPYTVTYNTSLSNLYYNGVWHHICGTYDVTTRDLYLYYDGNQVDFNGSGPTSVIFGTYPLTIATYDIAATTRDFNGQIDEVRIWNKALTINEIRENMYKHLTGSESNLRAYYKMNEGSGSSTTDNSGNGFTGTLGNTPTWQTSTAPLPYETSANGNWNSSSSWLSGQGYPANAWSIVKIGHAITANGNYSVKDITIHYNGQLTIDPTYTFTITNSILIESTSASTGSLVNSGTLTTTGATATVQRWFEGGGAQGMNHFVSSPISNATGANLWGATVGSSLKPWRWDESNDVWVAVYTGQALTPGKGYSVPYKSNKTLVFTGALNDGNITVNLTKNGSGGATWDPYYHLIGNPYPSRISANAFVSDADNTEISGPLYFWSDDKSGGGTSYTLADYATWISTGSTTTANSKTPTDYIEVGQGFFVEAYSVGDIIFKNSHRANNSATLFTPEPDPIQRIWLSLFYQPENLYNEILIGFLADATNGYDRLYDAKKMKGNSFISFYSFIENDERPFVIQGMPSVFPEEYKAIPLGYNAGIAGEWQIDFNRAENIRKDLSLKLEDKEKGIMHDLKLGPYAFQTEIGDFNDRFVVHINLGTEEISGIEKKESNLTIYSHQHRIILNDPEMQAENILIYDVSGKLLQQVKVGKSDYHSIHTDYTAGVYIVKVQTRSGEIAGKVLFE